MKSTTQNQQDNDKAMINPVVAAVAGAVVGAGAVVVGTMAMRDEKTRNTVNKALGQAKDKAVDYLKDVENKAMNAEQKVAKQIKAEVKKI